MSGYAWSNNIGWISFNSSELTGCPSGTCEARFNSGTGQIAGWARAYRTINIGGQTLGEWDGWIKLNTTAGNLRIITSSGPPYEFAGWASGSADASTGVVGWLSFSGDNYAGGADFQVQLNEAINRPPSANISSAPITEYCSGPPTGSANFSWTYSDPDVDAESKFQFQVSSASDFNSLAVDATVNSPGYPANNQAVLIVNSPLSGQLAYNTTYYWRVKVFDEHNADSGWASGPSFATSKHAWPFISFNWSPVNPSASEDVLFGDQAVIFGGASKVSWLWNFQNGAPGTSVQQNPIIQFVSEGNKQVSLRVTDSDGYACTGNKQVNVNLPLPKWKEITPR